MIIDELVVIVGQDGSEQLVHIRVGVPTHLIGNNSLSDDMVDYETACPLEAGDLTPFSERRPLIQCSTLTALITALECVAIGLEENLHKGRKVLDKDGVRESALLRELGPFLKDHGARP